MYIVKNTSGYAVSDNAADAVAVINAPIIEENGEEFSLVADSGVYSANGFECTEKTEDKGDGLFALTRTLKNAGSASRTFKFIFEAVTEFVPTMYNIPCVNYNGNYHGEGKEPKGMIHENGEVWIHSYDRTPIPSCSVTENKTTAFALFADASTPESQVSSVSLRPVGDKISQRIYWPVTEAPFTYCETDTYTDRYDTYLTLGTGETHTVTVYMLCSEPKWENYGTTAVLDRALELFPFKHGANRPVSEIWRLGMAYNQFLLREYKGNLLFAQGIHYPEGKPVFVNHYEVGWCGQNIMNARMLMIESLRTGKKELLDKAMTVCDNWVKKQSDCGLLLAHYEWYTEGRNFRSRDDVKSNKNNVDYTKEDVEVQVGWMPETCNTGWAACEMLKTWALLRENGIDRPDYKEFALKILDFFCEHFSEKFGFGKTWSFEGECIDKNGTIGAFVTMALCEGYRFLGEKKYLDYAVKSLDFYMERDLKNFICTAGAIDCSCVDKETAGPVVISALDLYEFTKDERFLDYAIKASYYFASWMYTYDVYYAENSEFNQYGYYTSGSTYVSVQHPALDQWGELMCCEWLRLADYTGDERWRKRALMMWYNATQFIADENNRTIHGMERPIGSQNEAFYQARWGHRPDCNERGHLNDWLVSWVNVFRLNVLDRLTRINKYPDRSALD